MLNHLGLCVHLWSVARNKIREKSMDLTKMVHFAIRILTPVLASLSLVPVCKVYNLQYIPFYHSYSRLQSTAIYWKTSPGKTEPKERKIWNSLFVLKVSGLYFTVTERTFSLNLLCVSDMWHANSVLNRNVFWVLLWRYCKKIALLKTLQQWNLQGSYCYSV